jgi:predicted protein tyrosine phosphatase
MLKEKLPYVLVFNHKNFDAYCEQEGYNDNNVETFNDLAFISICGSLEDDGTHYFKENHSNVLNVRFDDVTDDLVIGGVTLYKTITYEQAKVIFDFIEENIERTFIIHCLAGISRSQAVAKFILNNYEMYSYGRVNKDNPPINHNPTVLRLLNNIFRLNYLSTYGKEEI